MINTLAPYQLISGITPTQGGNFFILYANEMSLTGTVASVLGFFLSCYVVYTAKRINKFILYNKRIPQLQRDVKDHATSISRLINDFDNSLDKLRDEMTRCAANLKALRKKVPRAQKKPIDSLISLIASTASSSTLSKDVARNIYLQLLSIIVEIQNLQDDYQMER